MDSHQLQKTPDPFNVPTSNRSRLPRDPQQRSHAFAAEKRIRPAGKPAGRSIMHQQQLAACRCVR
jgi:hypothetical protein